MLTNISRNWKGRVPAFNPSPKYVHYRHLNLVNHSPFCLVTGRFPGFGLTSDWPLGEPALNHQSQESNPAPPDVLERKKVRAYTRFLSRWKICGLVAAPPMLTQALRAVS